MADAPGGAGHTRRPADEARGSGTPCGQVAERRCHHRLRHWRGHHLGGAPDTHSAWSAILVSGNLATMANALPYAIAAQVAYPERQCVAFVGDGGFSMLMAEFSTCVKYQLPLKIVVFKNNELGMIKWEQLVFLGNPQYGIELEPIDHVKFAEACGGRGFRIDDPKQCAQIMQRAFEAPGR